MIQETQLSTYKDGNEIQNVSVTISVPVKDIAGLAAVNYDNFDYSEIASKVVSEIDMSSLASDVSDEIDIDDIAEKVIESIEMADIAKAFKDSIEISDYFDTDQIASEAADQIDVEDKIHTLLKDYSPSNSCGTGNAATKAIINAIRFDIMSHLYGQDRSNVDVTITDILKKFIKKELATIEENKTTFTIGEIVDTLWSTNRFDNKITEVIKAFSDKIPNLEVKTYVSPNFTPDNPEVIIKAD